ncbi:MAG: VWA domain-containing protein [Acidobacteriota bacterium]
MRDTVDPRRQFWWVLRTVAPLLLVLIIAGGYQNGAAAGREATQGRPRRVSPEAPQPQKPAEPATKKTDPAQPPAQTPAQPGTPKKENVEEQAEAIRISSNLVTVPVSVTDPSGQPVKNLTAKDFQLDEEGERQAISLVGQPGQTPVELALLFDVSGSVNERFRFEQQAAARFLRAVLKPNDLVSVFSVSLIPKLIVPRTRDVEVAVAGAMSLGPTKEPTAFYDAIGLAAQYLGKTAAPGTRRVLVVISDGEDNQSEKFRLEETLRELQRNDCLYYSINPSGPSIRLNKISQKGQDSMIALAAETGGVAFLPQQLEDLDQIFHQIAGELQAQYLLGYYSTNEATDGKFRRITARISGRSELRVRSRQGYYAPRE